MKMTRTITMASALLLAAGCAHEEHSVRTEESVSPSYGYSTGGTEYNRYNTQNNFSSSTSANGTYSGNAGTSGNYSSGASGTYSSTPTTDNGAYASTASGSQSDNTIVAQVREDLRRDPEIALIVQNIQISANNGAIILSGSVQSEEQKRQILSRVQKVTGVATVNNQLTVMSGANGQQNSQMNRRASTPGMTVFIRMRQMARITPPIMR